MSNIGTPQGDALSGILFTIYFEYALRKVRRKLTSSNNHIINKTCSSKQIKISIPEEIIYADDADFLTDKTEKKKKLNAIIKETLLEENLKVNDDKTEHTTLIRRNVKKDNPNSLISKESVEPWRNVVKLGSKLGDSEDIAHRKQLSKNAMNRMNNIWIKSDKI